MLFCVELKLKLPFPYLKIYSRHVFRSRKLKQERKSDDKVAVISTVKVKVKVSHSLIAVGAVGVRVPLYLGHS